MRRLVVLACATLALGGCVWKYSLHGGGLPAHIKNVAVLPFDNQTASTELQRELAEAVRKAMSSRLGLREASEEKATAIVRGTIIQYDMDVPVGFSANPAQATSARRRLQVHVDVEIDRKSTRLNSSH